MDDGISVLVFLVTLTVAGLAAKHGDAHVAVWAAIAAIQEIRVRQARESRQGGASR